MKKQLIEIFNRKGIDFFHTDKQVLDYYNFEPYQDNNESFNENVIFETDTKEIKKIEPFYNSIFQFFIDGSRKPYKIGDMITTDKKFAPVIAGQIGAVCCRRINKKLEPFTLLKKNLFLVIDCINESDYIEIKEELSHIWHIDIEIDRYNYEKIKSESPTNAAIARINKRMQDLEIELLKKLVSDNILTTDKMLVIDGSLQFLTQRFDKRIFYNVIGISKSFNPNLTGILRGRKHIGVLLTKLNFGERTPVYKYETSNKQYSIGAWYLRIRPTNKIKNPLDGIIKIEKMAMDQDTENNGFDSSMIDNVSSSILGEIHPTCHGNDTRWCNHLYPIYLTEKYLKSKFFSDIHYMNIF